MLAGKPSSIGRNWGRMLSLRRLPGRVIWTLVIVLAGVVLASGFGLLDVFGSQAAPAPDKELKISVGQTGLRIEASASGADEIVWKYRLLTSGEVCGSQAFALSPNHPEIHSSNVLTVPETKELQDYYRHRFVCFQATALDTSGRQVHKVWGIDLGKPLVTVVWHFGEELGQRAYLQAESDEAVTYRLVRTAAKDQERQEVAGNYCSSLFAALGGGGRPHRIVTSTGRVEATEDMEGVCFEAADADDNRTYVYADRNAGRIRAYQQQNELRAFLRGTSADVEWGVFVSDSSECDEAAFEALSIAQTRRLPASQELSIGPLTNASHGKHYCFRAVEALGHRTYLAFEVYMPPTAKLRLENNQLLIAADRPISRASTIGPVTDDSRCYQIFENADALAAYDPLGGTEVEVDTGAGNRYCVMIEDDRGVQAYKEFVIQGPRRGA